MSWVCAKCHARYEEHPGQCPRDGAALAPDLEGRELLGRYRIGRLIGAGGMGCVFEALQLAVQRKVAIKFLPVKEPGISARFRREALTVSQFEHHNTITVFDFGETEDGMLFLVMELLDGRDLAQALKEEGALPVGRALHVFDQVLASLGEAHSRGIVHRDLKPENIFLIHRGDDPDFVKVLDFGLAKIFHSSDSGLETTQESLTQDGAIFGTPHYMSPEQAMGRPVDQRADLYSAGVVLHQLLTGRFLFVADSLPIVMYKQVEAPPPPLSEARPDLSFPPGLEEYVLHLLEKDPAKRPQTTGEAQTLLAPLLLAAQQDETTLLSAGDRNRILGRVEQSRANLAAMTTRLPSGPAAGPATGRDGGRSRSLVILAVALGALLLLLGGGVVAGLIWWSQVHGGPSAPGPEERERAALVRAAAAEQAAEAAAAAAVAKPALSPTVGLRVVSLPAGAQVQREGRPLGVTPLRLELPRQPQSFRLVVTLKGYASEELPVTLEPGEARDEVPLELTLKKGGRAGAASRAAPPGGNVPPAAAPAAAGAPAETPALRKPKIQVIDE